MFEIIGFPGSGKSYLVNNYLNTNIDLVSEDDYNNQCKKINIFQKILSTLKIIFVFLDIFILLFIYGIFFSNSKRKFFKMQFEFFKYNVLLNVIFKNKKSKQLFDQSIIQYLWSFILMENRKMKYSSIFKYIFKKYIKKYKITICYYLVDYKTAAKQATSRKKKCFTDYYNLDDLISLYYIHSEDYKLIKEYSKNNFYIIKNVYDLNDIINKVGDN